MESIFQLPHKVSITLMELYVIDKWVTNTFPSKLSLEILSFDVEEH
jgi:hypothetical protein